MFNITNFFINPVTEIVAPYTAIIGVWFYVILLVVIDGYVLIKTESWGTASITAIFIAVIFSAILPSYLVWIWSVAAVFSLAALIVDAIWLK